MIPALGVSLFSLVGISCKTTLQEVPGSIPGQAHYLFFLWGVGLLREGALCVCR